MSKSIVCRCLLAASLLSTPCFADIVVIINPANANSLSQDDLSKIFLGKTRAFPNGDAVVAINQTGDIAESFNDKALHKTSTQLKAYWSKLVFTGKGTPPKEVDSDAEVKKLVAENPSLIGYIDSASADGSVKVVLTL